VSDAEREHLLAPSSFMIVSFRPCMSLGVIHTADSVHVTTTYTASLDLDIDIYTQLESNQSQGDRDKCSP
jgi:hypothetical protein